ncbi:MAG: ATP-dependent helicase HrpB [Pseudomonadota bacterium]
MCAERLPVDDVIPDLTGALARAGQAVLVAPPGAGKTTRVPLALLPGTGGRILMLEPRRLAARASAERMAETLGEPVGRTVGYRIRGESKVSAATRIEVVTEGILTRMIQSDPELPGVGCVIFDEFHERSLNADLGLALALELRDALRPDLRLLVMSATLAAEPVAALMGGAPVIRSEGRAHPVETRWLDRPAGRAFEAEVARLVARAADETGPDGGGILVFLPGEGEIRRVGRMLAGLLPADCRIRPLYGALDAAGQRAAIRPEAAGRKVVLATAIAETSLTIEDIRVVVDGGRARRQRFDPASGMARLVTERASRAEADQRRGRAGRVAPGTCYRLWTRGEEGAMAAFAPPEIETGDLTGLALELALWGSADLRFLTPPPAPAMAEARALLDGLGATEAGRITGHGRALAALPLHPRIGHMLLTAGRQASELAALLSDRDLLMGAPADLSLRIEALARDRGASVDKVRAEAARLARLAPADRGALSVAAMAALAYPDRVGMRRPGEGARYLLASGKGALVREGDPLGRARFIVATDLDGDPREARVRQGAALDESELRDLFADRIRWHETCEWSRREGRVTARREERFGALVLSERPGTPSPDALARAALDGLRQTGLSPSPAAGRLMARVAFLRAQGEDLPDLSEAAILDREDWLLPHLGRARTEADLRGLDLVAVIREALGWEGVARLDRLAPPDYETPLGRRIAIDYEGGQPAIALRLQEMFGVTEHPVAGPRRLPLKVTLLSPAGRPIQVTTDLPRFWASSYADVRKDMRGQYPKHPWPEDPTAAAPTLRAKPRPG